MCEQHETLENSGQVTHTCQVLRVRRVWAAEHTRGQLRNCLSSRWLLTLLSQEIQGLPLEVVFVFELIITIWMIKKSEQSSLPLTLMRHHRVQTGTECQVHPSLFSSQPPLPSFSCGTIVVGITYVWKMYWSKSVLRFSQICMLIHRLTTGVSLKGGEGLAMFRYEQETLSRKVMGFWTGKWTRNWSMFHSSEMCLFLALMFCPHWTGRQAYAACSTYFEISFNTLANTFVTQVPQ